MNKKKSSRCNTFEGDKTIKYFVKVELINRSRRNCKISR